MAVTVEIDGNGIRIVDTAAFAPVPGPNLVTSLAVAEWVLDRRSVATAVTDQALGFGRVAAAKVICVVSDYEITLKVDGETPGPLGKQFLRVHEDGDFTSATISNASGSTAIVNYLVAGAT